MSLSDLPNIKVSQLNDDQIRLAWKKLQDSGISEQDAYKLLLQKGMPAGEVEELKNRVTLLGLNKSSSNKVPTSAEKKDIDFSRTINDSLSIPKRTKPALPPAKPVLNVYGTDFFNQQTIKFEPNFNIATPKGYVLGPGDEVIVLVTGLNESSVRSKISPEGNLQIPYAGIVYVNGFTIEQATNLIKSKMSRVYPALKSGQTQLTVNLGNTRSIKITIVGEAKTPGSYTLSSLSTLFNALYNSGGPTINGSLRNIELIRNNKIYKTIDFYSFLQQGLLTGNIRLEDQDVINIPVYKKRAGISGEVKRPAIYELKENETLDDLIKYAGGYTDVAYKGIAKIDQINAMEREVKDVPANLLSNYIPHNGDLVEIGAITNRYTNRITLEGAVYRPGVYELTAGFTLASLLKSAQGLKPEAYMELGYIKRTLPNLEKDQISFKPSEILNGRNDIPLLREDSVVILDRDIFTPNQKVTINGFVRKPAVFTYRKGLKLADVIAMAGGFDEQAANHHVEISRIIKNESDSVANQLVSTFVVDMDNTSATNHDVELMPMDYINVPRLVNYRSLGNVSIKGEVLFPGNYAVQKRDETVLDFLKRAGGITPYGSVENAQVYRKGVRVNLNLTETGINEAARKNMIMLPGDSIFVPRVISYVEVAGAVNNPQYVNYLKPRFKYYTNAAGGVTQNARLKGAYIKYPNGLNRPVRHFLFFRSYPTVKPGSKIVVPQKSPESRFKIGFGDVAVIVAPVLTAIVSLFAILHK
ncbi:SLBB domain-containing protein [Mucilaginibacter sp.]|uniref:SLBB domain-containing protein n=1 Tax=Mucilaginibacter sp. TaxID=1882438 RepID=UPI003B002682